MKKVEYIVDSFVDYTGTTRKFVMAAVSMHETANVDIFENDYVIDNDNKVLSIGVSVCRPADTFNEELGKHIAEGKAIKYRDHAIYAVDAGLINDKMVKALLEQEADYFKVNPGRYLAGYDKDAKKYKQDTEMLNYIDSMHEDAGDALDLLAKMDKTSLDAFNNALDYVRGK